MNVNESTPKILFLCVWNVYTESANTQMGAQKPWERPTKFKFYMLQTKKKLCTFGTGCLTNRIASQFLQHDDIISYYIGKSLNKVKYNSEKTFFNLSKLYLFYLLAGNMNLSVQKNHGFSKNQNENFLYNVAKQFQMHSKVACA